MTRLLFGTAFLLGAIAIVWMGSIFIGTDALALAVTVVIGGVYTIGFIEQVQFRRETATLSNALSVLPGNSSEKVISLDTWLDRLDPSLRNSVRLRIEGERVGLPAPVITPYLVGLLVMLGLLGTFVGMVVTLKGAVIALEGTTELQAIRAGLAAPIKGLGLAFGTSVAGVAASAMLGLISTLSRRERMLATRLLDSKISTLFRDVSLVHNRQETYKALQAQAQALPDVAEKLCIMAEKLERMGDELGSHLTANQNSFHESAKRTYLDLAASVDTSLRESVVESGRLAAESARLAGESLKPVVQDAMSEISNHIQQGARDTHSQLTRIAQEQLETLSARFTDTAEDVSKSWQAGLEAYEHSNEALTGGMNKSFNEFSGQFELMTQSVLESLDKTSTSWAARQEVNDRERLDLWLESFGQAQRQAATNFGDTSKTFTNELKQTTESQQAAFRILSQDFEALSTALTQQWQQAGEQALSHQQKVVDSMEGTSRALIDNARLSSAEMLDEMTTLLKSSEQLVATRIATEETWLTGHEERMNALTGAIKTELLALRKEEELRGQAAVERLAGLETTVSSHLTLLGKELEEPMTRLIQTASETPRAAAEVIEHLRNEISNNIERDNKLLEERRCIMEELNTLSSSLKQTSGGQREAVEMLVTSSATMLKDVGAQFSNHVGSEVAKISSIAESLAGSATEISDNFSGSATEMSSLGEAFGHAVQLFNESNSNLVEHLIRIEESLQKSTSRSDEQLGYYVAQAREIIDHSMVSQREIFEELHQLKRKGDLIPSEAI